MVFWFCIGLLLFANKKLFRNQGNEL